MSKESFFEFWGLKPGPEADRIWADKQKMDAGGFRGKAPMLNCDIQPWDAYISPTTGKAVTSYAQRREDMKASGCVDYEPSLIEHQQKRYQEEDRLLDKKVEEHVEETIALMPTQKQEQLGRELEAFDIDITKN